jgi:hypothetical protein
MVIERWVREHGDWVWHILTRGLDWYVVILVEVDASLLLAWVVGYAVQLTLDTLIGWAWNVLAVNPLAIARACRATIAGIATTAASSCTISLAGRNMGWVGSVAGDIGLVPGATWWWTSITRSEAGSTRPRWRATIETIRSRSRRTTEAAARASSTASTLATHVWWNV